MCQSSSYFLDIILQIYLTFSFESLGDLHNKCVIKTFAILNNASIIIGVESIVNEKLTAILPSFHKIFMIGKLFVRLDIRY